MTRTVLIGSRGTQLTAFLRERFPASYVLYGVMWAIATEAGAVVLSGADWRPGVDTALITVTLLLCLVGLRMIDDVKDLEYDVEHHPERVVPSGRVAANTLVSSALVAFATALILTAVWFGPTAATALVVAQLYGLGLWLLEKRVPAVTRNPFSVLAVSYPVQVLLTAAMLTSVMSAGVASWDPAHAALFVVFGGAFLQLEIARKTSVESTPEPGFYSGVLPWRACAGIVIALGLVAVLTWVAVSAPWRHEDNVAVVSGWASVVLVCLPVLAVAEMLTGRRRTPRGLAAAGLIFLLYLAIGLTAVGVS